MSLSSVGEVLFMAIKQDLKEVALQLRTVQRKSLREIAKITGISRGTLSVFLRPFPLTEEELAIRWKRGALPKAPRTIRPAVERTRTGGTTAASSYVAVRLPDGYKGKPVANLYVYEHRLVVEQYLGRLLCKDETVHHLNDVKTDNRLANLVVISPFLHHWIHNTSRGVKMVRMLCVCGEVFSKEYRKTHLGKNTGKTTSCSIICGHHAAHSVRETLVLEIWVQRGREEKSPLLNWYYNLLPPICPPSDAR